MILLPMKMLKGFGDGKLPQVRENSLNLSGLGSSGGHSDKQQLPGILIGGKFPGVSAMYFFSVSIDEPIH
jgi:hypothetical protein